MTELLGPTIRDFHGVLPLLLVKRISKHVLLGLQYMHDDCDMVHTGEYVIRTGICLSLMFPDIKGDNIFMTGAPPPVHPVTAPLSESELATTTFVLGDMSSSKFMS